MRRTTEGPSTVQKSLDAKLARIAADPSCGDFILADAKDADMAFGISAPGVDQGSASGATRFRSIQQFRDHIREIVEQRLVDIMLMSVSTLDALNEKEPLFDDSPVTPAFRANDTTDIWLAGSPAAGLTEASYGRHPSLPFRTAILEEVMEVSGIPFRQPPIDLGLYSITLNNDAALDRATLHAYHDFRVEARELGLRHFLEVFAPNAAPQLPPADVPRFVNDSIVRLLAGIGVGSRPLFLKMPYFGPDALQQLVKYDSSLVVGILGGSAGTTFDAFQMLWEAKRYGARAALFGRKINAAESQLTFVRHLRALADGGMEPHDAVRSYHSELEKLRIRPHRVLADDLRASRPA
jgi:hypothetical protein